ncbi:MAG: tetratricopeptide repeat protein [Schleiferiaceae bacterium]
MIQKSLGLTLVFLLSTLLSWSQITTWETSVGKVYEEGKTLYDQGLYGGASQKFEEVLNSNIDKKSLWYERAQYYHAMTAVYRMNVDADRLMTAFAEDHPTSPLLQEGILETATYFFNKKRYKKAQQWLLKLNPDDLSGDVKYNYLFKRGYTYFDQKENDKAKADFYSVLDKEFSMQTSAQYYYAHLSYVDSNYVTALKYFIPLKEDPSFGPIVPYYLAQIYYQTEQYDELLEVGESLIDQAAESRVPEIAKLIGNAFYQRKDYLQALPYLELYKDKGGKMRVTDWYELGFTYYRLEKYNKAKEAFNKIVKGKNDLVQNAYFHLADCYLKTDQKAEALVSFRAASQIDVDPAIAEEANFLYAKLSYEVANPYEDAIKALTDFHEKYPNSLKLEEVNNYLANLFLTTKDYDRALKALNRTNLNSLPLQEAYQKVSYYKGVEVYNALMWKQAIALFEQSRKYPINQTTLALSYFWEAEAYFRTQEMEKALASLNQFQKVPGVYNLSEFPASLYNEAYALFYLERYGDAATQFRLFLDDKKATASRYQDAQVRLADCYFMIANYAQASKYYKSYTKQKKAQDMDYALFQWSLCEGLKGNPQTKANLLNQLIDDYPTSKYAISGQYELASTYLKQDQYQQALAVYQRFVTNYPQSTHAKRAYLQMGVIYRNMDEYDKSIEQLKKVVETYPATPEANEAISFAKLVYSKTNNMDEYITWVESIDFADVKKAALDSTVYTTAYDYYGLGDCAQAIEGFNTYLERFPLGYFANEAHFYLAECSYAQGDLATAKTSYDAVASAEPNAYTERSLAKLAYMAYQDDEFAKAIEYYDQMISSSEDINTYRTANVGLMRSHQKEGHLMKAIQYAEIIIGDDKMEPEVVNEAYVIKARNLWETENVNAAHQAFIDLEKIAEGEPKAEAKYYLAQIMHDKGEYDSSNAKVFDLIENLPGYPEWRYRALIVLSKNYYALDDPFQANYTLDFVIDKAYSEEIVNAAKEFKMVMSQEKTQREMERDRREEELNNTYIDLSGLTEIEEMEESPSEEIEKTDKEENTNEIKNESDEK